MDPFRITWGTDPVWQETPNDSFEMSATAVAVEEPFEAEGFAPYTGFSIEWPAVEPPEKRIPA